jgi:hypothetical protein
MEKLVFTVPAAVGMFPNVTSVAWVDGLRFWRMRETVPVRATVRIAKNWPSPVAVVRFAVPSGGTRTE